MVVMTACALGQHIVAGHLLQRLEADPGNSQLAQKERSDQQARYQIGSYGGKVDLLGQTRKHQTRNNR